MHKHSLSKLILINLCISCTYLLIFLPHSQAQTFPANFSQVQVANGITNPTVMEFSPDGRLFVAQQNGQLRIIKNGALLPQPFISLNVNSNGERGLLGIAFDPNFSSNQWVYLYYTISSGANNRISRFTANGDVAVAGSESVVLNLDPLSTATNHNGGTMKFGPDGKLYVGVGENANPNNSQDLDTYLGKLLRINADGSVPAGNPFTSGTNQRKRIWSYGLRNPYTITFQPGTGTLYVNDVGQSAWEEINNATTGGLNFGWPSAEGFSSNPAYTNPVYAYPHGSGVSQGCAITGGTFFNPSFTNYPSSYVGKYFFIDYCSNWIDMLTFNGSVSNSNFASNIAHYPVDLITGPDGNLYFTSRNDSAVYRITYNIAAPTITLNPVADAYIRDGAFANVNYGQATRLYSQKNSTAGNRRVMYLRFDISNLNTGVGSAILRLYGSLNNTLNASEWITVCPVPDNSWQENSITWNNKPASQSQVLARRNIIGTDKHYHDFDLTAYIAGLRANGINYVSLKLYESSESTSAVEFNSGEANFNKPRLVVKVGPAQAGNADKISDGNIPVLDKLSGEFLVYPNPTTGLFYVENNKGLNECTYTVYDINMRPVITERKMESSKNQVDITGLEKGLYFIRMKNNTDEYWNKIILIN
jgi:glucose/arabinose dehydrogenase